MSFEVGVARDPDRACAGRAGGARLARHQFAWRMPVSNLLLMPLIVPGDGARHGDLRLPGRGRDTGSMSRPVLGTFGGLVAGHIADRHPLGGAPGHGEPRRLRPQRSRRPRRISAPTRCVTFRRITLPVIRPGIVAGALFAFVISFGNLEMSLFLVGPGPHDLADRHPAVPRMEDRSDHRGGLGRADLADRRPRCCSPTASSSCQSGLNGATRHRWPRPSATATSTPSRDVSLGIPRRRVPGAARSLGLRQDDDLAHDRGLHRAERRAM